MPESAGQEDKRQAQRHGDYELKSFVSFLSVPRARGDLLYFLCVFAFLIYSLLFLSVVICVICLCSRSLPLSVDLLLYSPHTLFLLLPSCPSYMPPSPPLLLVFHVVSLQLTSSVRVECAMRDAVCCGTWCCALLLLLSFSHSLWTCLFSIVLILQIYGTLTTPIIVAMIGAVST